MKICVVDDDPNMVKFITMVLQTAGHSVIGNISPSLAIPKIIEFKPDCLITDLMMAELDGIELCRQLKDRVEVKDMTIIFVSAQRGDYWKKQAQEAGAHGYIVKPLEPSTFIAEIERIVGERSSSGA